MLLTQAFKCRRMEVRWGYFCHPWRKPVDSPACLGRFSLLCCGAGSLGVDARDKWGSQLPAGWPSTGQAQLSRGARGRALLTRWSQRNPVAQLAFLPAASSQPHCHTPIHRVTVTWQTATESLKGSLGALRSMAQPTLPVPEIPHGTVVLGSILGRTSVVWTQQWHRGRTEDRVLYYIWKRSFHFASKLLVKLHLTDCRVIALWAAFEFRRQVWWRVHLTIRCLIPSKQVSHHCMVLDT